MKLKKIIRYLLKTLFVLFVILFAYFVYLAIWTYQFNADQEKIIENIDADFYQTSQIIRDPNGYLGTVATINGQHTDTLLFDTQVPSKKPLTDTRRNIGDGNRCRHLISTSKSIFPNYTE